MQKYKKISRFLTFKRFLYQTEEYFYYYFEKTNRNYTNILFFFPTKQKQVSILFLSLPSNLIEVILNKFMSYLITPEGYKPLLDLKQTELGIKQIKEFFQLNLSSELRLRRVTAPLFVLKGMGINDDLNGVERAVTFPIKDLGDAKAEVVHSLAKWKRLTLAEYHIEPGYGIYTDMNAIRADEELGNLHSLYVDQWDWERVITAEDRNVEFLKEIVTRIYAAMVRTEYMVYEMYPQIKPCLPQKLHFIHAEELRQLYPDLEPKCREHAICKKYGAVFIIGIGCKLSDGKKHDGLEISGYVSVERKDGRVVDGGFVRSDNNHGFGLGGFDGFRVGGHDIGPGAFLVGACGLRANAYGLFTAQPRVARFKKNVGEGFLAANRRTEHGRLLGSCECLSYAKGHDVAAVCCFRADNGDAG